MITDIHSKSPMNPQPEAAGDIARRTADAARDVTATAKDLADDTYQSLSSKVEEGVERTREFAQHAVDATKDAAHRATDTVKDIYHSASAKAEDALETSKEYVRQNPFPVALGTLITGLAIGYLIGITQREEPTFRQRFLW